MTKLPNNSFMLKKICNICLDLYNYKYILFIFLGPPGKTRFFFTVN